jgi:hypothetical protein
LELELEIVEVEIEEVVFIFVSTSVFVNDFVIRYKKINEYKINIREIIDDINIDII